MGQGGGVRMEVVFDVHMGLLQSGLVGPADTEMTVLQGEVFTPGS